MNNLPALKTIRDELSILSHKELVSIVTSMVKFRKENKELITYLLFDSKDEAGFVRSTIAEIDEAMSSINRFNAKQQIKHICKVLRLIRKAIKISGKHDTAVQLLLHFCKIFKEKNIPIYRFKGLNLIWDRCLSQIETELTKVHEDLRYDYNYELSQLRE